MHKVEAFSRVLKSCKLYENCKPHVKLTILYELCKFKTMVCARI